MAKGRLLHKKICLSEQVNLLPNDTARLLYTWIISHLDVEGRFYGDARRVKSTIFPLRAISDRSVERYLQEMETRSLIVRYEVNGQMYMWVPTFSSHQTLRKDRERKSYIPAPPDEVLEQYKREDRYSRYGICPDCGEPVGMCECEEE